MAKNYTPLDIDKLEKNQLVTKHDDFNYNTVLLLIATLTIFVIAALLFILIQRKTSSQNIQMIEVKQKGPSASQAPDEILISPLKSPEEATSSPTMIPKKP